MRPRIALNAVSLHPGRTGGAETYLLALLESLQRLDLAEEFFVFAARDHNLRLTHPRFQLVECNVSAARKSERILWEQLVLPRLLRQYRIDLAHFPYATLPLRYQGPAVVTMHDTVRLVQPEALSGLQRIYRRLMERRMIAAGHHLIAVSAADARNLQTHLKLPAERISVVPHGVDAAFLKTDESLAGGTPQKDAMRRGLLWVGRPYPTKNLETLLAACRLLQQSGELREPLRLVGIEADQQLHWRQRVAEAGLSGCVSLEGPVPHAELPALYRSARLLVYPSTLESFGLPVLEAMACGTPVVAADIPAFREYHAGIAVLADPHSPEDFAANIRRLLRDEKAWQTLSQRCREHARRFTWQRCAQRTAAVYRRLLNGDEENRDVREGALQTARKRTA